MPNEIVTRILRLPGYGIYQWKADEANNTLTLWIHQTARHPSYVCGHAAHVIGRILRADLMPECAVTALINRSNRKRLGREHRHVAPELIAFVRKRIFAYAALHQQARQQRGA